MVVPGGQMSFLPKALLGFLAALPSRIVQKTRNPKLTEPSSSPAPDFRIYSPIWIGRPRSRRSLVSRNKYAWAGQYRRVAVITRQLKRASARNRQHLMRHAA